MYMVYRVAVALELFEMMFASTLNCLSSSMRSALDWSVVWFSKASFSSCRTFSLLKSKELSASLVSIRCIGLSWLNWVWMKRAYPDRVVRLLVFFEGLFGRDYLHVGVVDFREVSFQLLL